MSKRDRILETAFFLFAENSYKYVSIDRIAQKAGVAKGTVLYHFKSKYNLALESLISGIIKLTMELREKISKETDPKKNLFTMISDVLSVNAKYPKLNRFSMDLLDLSEESKSFMKIPGRYYNATLQEITKYLIKSDTPHPEIRAQILKISIDGLLVRQESFRGLKNNALDMSTIIQELIDLILKE